MLLCEACNLFSLQPQNSPEGKGKYYHCQGVWGKHYGTLDKDSLEKNITYHTRDRYSVQREGVTRLSFIRFRFYLCMVSECFFHVHTEFA